MFIDVQNINELEMVANDDWFDISSSSRKKDDDATLLVLAKKMEIECLTQRAKKVSACEMSHTMVSAGEQFITSPNSLPTFDFVECWRIK